MRILVTGFEPFGGEAVNPSLEAVQRLENQIAGAEIIKQSLPVVFQKPVEQLIVHMEAVRPDVVICVGQAGGVSGITVERIAVNLMDASIADNEGNQPEDVPVLADGPAAYFSSLPVKTIVQRIKDNGLPAVLSNSAGTYVCNNTMYGLLHHIAQHCPGVRGGFIHVPYIPEQVLDRPGKASMALGDIVRAIGYAIEAVVENMQNGDAAG
jgi:pyroglutamyl-peptidase